MRRFVVGLMVLVKLKKSLIAIQQIGFSTTSGKLDGSIRSRYCFIEPSSLGIGGCECADHYCLCTFSSFTSILGKMNGECSISLCWIRTSGEHPRAVVVFHRAWMRELGCNKQAYQHN